MGCQGGAAKGGAKMGKTHFFRVPNFVHDFFTLNFSLGSETHVKNISQLGVLRGRG